MTEVWERLIYHGEDYGDYYEVSSYGQIRNSKTKKIRKQNLLQTGYCFVNGSLGSRENKITFKVHRAVAETFISNPNNLPEINHKDCSKLNNDVNNLEWCTGAENIKHAVDNGLMMGRRGEKSTSAKLTIKQVEYIRNNYIPRHYEFGARGLARKFNVCHTTILKIINNISWIE